MKYVAKITVGVLVVTAVLAMLPTIIPYSFSTEILAFKKYVNYLYSFVNPYTLYVCLLITLAVNSSGFIIKIVNFIMDKINSAS
ncbi:TPA: hypothetical protein J0W29_002668 [Enterococcus faecium]|uniref:hypothetical protein n=1 Tax=Enterococcus faecium TaxID=1352 RepID=UPI0002A21F8C|nr:hypothetical protein [Enterococcus faecium]ELB15991.1 hypothetical protein OIQ_05596 [Enterococcus faecium EnGen0025]HAZ1672903.1 hypothetical protein [Enterococcus faecium]